MLRYFIVFILLSFTLPAQDPDTLLPHILAIDNDTVRAGQLFRYGFDLADKNPQLALTYAQHCEKAALKSRSKKFISKSYNLSGIIFLKLGLYKRSLPYFEKYLSEASALNDPSEIAFAYRNLGNIYLRLKQFAEAEHYWLLAMDHFSSVNNKTEVANELINLGVLKHQQKQLEAALNNYEKALQIGKELNSYEIKEICLNNLAQIFFDRGDHEKALACNFDALELRELMSLDINITDSHLSIAEIALKQKNTELAEEHLNLALSFSDKLSYLEGKATYHKLAAELYSQKNNYQSAYENLKLYNALNDSLITLHTDEPTGEFKELISERQASTERSMPNLWLLVLLTLFLIIIPFVLFRYKR
jgi:tetratricopeptide (TPR) repeat protein